MAGLCSRNTVRTTFTPSAPRNTKYGRRLHPHFPGLWSSFTSGCIITYEGRRILEMLFKLIWVCCHTLGSQASGSPTSNTDAREVESYYFQNHSPMQHTYSDTCAASDTATFLLLDTQCFHIIESTHWCDMLVVACDRRCGVWPYVADHV